MEESERIRIVRGEDATIRVKIRDEDGDPVNLSQVTAIEARLKKRGTGFVSRSLAGGDIIMIDAARGIFTITWRRADTEQLVPTAAQTMETIIDFGGIRRIVRFQDAVMVIDRIQ